MGRRIFVSYSRKEKAAVDELVAQLVAAGHDVWRDLSVVGGSDWWTTIVNEIATRDTFLVAVSAASLASAACVSELNYASQLHRHLLPVRVAGDFGTAQLSSLLARTQMIDFPSTPVLAVGLARAVSNLPEPNPLPLEITLPPPAPLSYLTALRDRLDSHVPLSALEQQETIAALRDGCRRADDVRDAQVMLRQMLLRPELLSRSADDIRETLQTTEQRNTPPPPPGSADGLGPVAPQTVAPQARPVPHRQPWPWVALSVATLLIVGLLARAAIGQRASSATTVVSTTSSATTATPPTTIAISSSSSIGGTSAPAPVDTTIPPETAPETTTARPTTTPRPSTTTSMPTTTAAPAPTWPSQANELCARFLPMVVQVVNGNSPTAYSDLAQVTDQLASGLSSLRSTPAAAGGAVSNLRTTVDRYTFAQQLFVLDQQSDAQNMAAEGFEYFKAGILALQRGGASECS
jgi:hypothetical protein